MEKQRLQQCSCTLFFLSPNLRICISTKFTHTGDIWQAFKNIDSLTRFKCSILVMFWKWFVFTKRNSSHLSIHVCICNVNLVCVYKHIYLKMYICFIFQNELYLTIFTHKTYINKYIHWIDRNRNNVHAFQTKSYQNESTIVTIQQKSRGKKPYILIHGNNLQKVQGL